MAAALLGLRDPLLQAVADVDVSRLSMADAHTLLDATTVMERSLAAVRAALAARVATSESWRAAGARSVAHHLARRTGTSVGQAQNLVQTGERLEALPSVAAAARAGQISPQQTQSIAAAAAVDPAAVPELLDLAPHSSVTELEEACANVVATATDLEEQRRLIHARRSLRTYRDRDGVAHFHLRSNPEVVAELVATIAPTRDRLFKAARAAGLREAQDALSHDALVTYVRDAADSTPGAAAPGTSSRCTTAGRRPAQAKILVRVDLDTLLRGHPVSGETCELVGYGPVPVSTVTDLIDAGAVLKAIATRGRQVQGVAHLGRKPTTAQTTALEWLNPSCAAEGCPHTIRLEQDHRTPWADAKITVLDLMDRLCTHHHRLKTTQNWALADGHGKRPFVPPTDTRHPDRTGRAAAARAGPAP